MLCGHRLKTALARGLIMKIQTLLVTADSAATQFAAGAASAQATRTWVSGVGDDANPCSRTAHCKTIAGAISKTAAGGEISVLVPGGFGTIIISMSISIEGGGSVGSLVVLIRFGFLVLGAGFVVFFRI